jgi:hypothetical protein
MVFSWDDVNREHIAWHGVTSDEPEDVVPSAETPFPQTIEDDKR